MPDEITAAGRPRVAGKLETEPIEDLRIDFEDGYGNRADAERGRRARAAAAQALAESVDAGTAAPFHRDPLQVLRGADPPPRDCAPSTCSSARCSAPAALTDGFLLTLPKVTTVDQVQAMVAACQALEDTHSLPADGSGFEIQVETPAGDPRVRRHRARSPRLIHAGGRPGHRAALRDLRLLRVDRRSRPSTRRMEHAVADYAKAVMQVAAAGTGVFLSDGSTNIVPVGDDEAVRRGWTPARAPGPPLARTRLLPGLGPAPGAAADPVCGHLRLLPRGFGPSRRRGCATTSTNAEIGVLDEPATARALARYLQRGHDCGALDEDELLAMTGVTADQLAALARPGSDTEAVTPHAAGRPPPRPPDPRLDREHKGVLPR